MPEHDETDAPTETQLAEEEEFWEELDEIAEKRRKSKVKRWGVEDKVVDGESK